MSEETAPQENSSQKPPKPGRRRRRVGMVLGVFILVGVIVGGYLWYRGQVEISTDDAFVEAHIHMISPRIPGHVRQILVKDNQHVHKGDLLVELDPADYLAKVAKAEASLAMAKNETSGQYAGVRGAQAAVQQSRADLEQADLDLKRAKALFARKVIPRQQLDRVTTARKVAAARLHEALQNLARVRANLGLAGDGSKEARVAQRRAELDLARLNLAYTRITAPTDGYVTRKSVELGNNVQAGQPLLALVQLSHPWVVANYKESQLTYVQPGQRVAFTVDAYPGRTFRGRVNSIMAGTGAAFSLLPPENATGNYVKVVQRVPVKINIDRNSDPQHVLRVGMSVVPTIYTGRTLHDILAQLNPFK